ncbi:MAG: hypothetical protein UU34_C0029G0008 [Candidatus Curtissbacteria bacterium GW2011_GWA1_41_11]|uniref:Uncharacterized protein n=1 Tax=Candidatus Curtissbacteria bacterium GW2011_GWA1_41_11 TaxID=1618409 RepID=A0A0G0UA43_9BACT|nr:MAG: hypothetical protein UU34_C0029G0008 [Candidatus Curtissbacteria bacterium GW2011_GWA1_41_11]
MKWRNNFNLLAFCLHRAKVIFTPSFTLIELIIVIGIVGLLASVVSVAVNPGKRIALANDAVRKQNFGGGRA